MSHHLPPVSIGIPFYNAEDTLIDAVRSVFSQTHLDWELILLDDGSTDNSLELARSIKDSRVKVYSDGQNRGLAFRLNQMPELATFDYIARMDADDLISPERLELQLKFMLSHPELDLVSTGICSLSDDNVPLGVRVVSKKYIVSPRSLLMANSGIVHASLLGRRAWFARNRYREDLYSSEDANLWVRAFSLDDLNIGFINKPLYYYREDGNVVYSKLSTAYQEVLYTIIRDSGTGFTSGEKAYGISITLTKLLVARLLSLTGSLTFLRKRRNGMPLSKNEANKIIIEIDYIKSFKLPM
ncbi:glycosyltransferase family 2 protein [Halomonas alimentaria]|uniref:glycosyltransferase family 2 protein n=1 Tax=Halomonas alimentaria TaxID=147248 RepID=UPI002490E749|nr:glycosyltransferase family 2 protein [Halomonas alimentaria]